MDFSSCRIPDEKREDAAVMLQQKVLAAAGEIEKAVIGKQDIVHKVLMAMLAKGHILLEDHPGVGKTTLALALARSLELDYGRIQFTPEVMPADVVGFTVIDRATGRLEYKPGGIFRNLFLADEINRTSAKTQSALLQAMEEGKVTVEGFTRPLPEPYTVIATQNPFGSAGTQMLPESQLDRFMVRLSMGYPDEESEIQILRQAKGARPLESILPVLTAEELRQCQREVEEVHIGDELLRYTTRLIAATRAHSLIRLGASPRAGMSLVRMVRACAWLSGRDYAIPKDIRLLLPDVLGHRLVLEPRARTENRTAPLLLEEILSSVREPKLLRKP